MPKKNDHSDLIKEIRELHLRLTSCVGPLSDVVNKVDQRGFPPAVASDLTRLANTVQELSDIAAPLSQNVAKPPQNTEKRDKKVKKAGKPRAPGRKKERAIVVKFMLLYAVFRHAPETERAISQNMLFDMLCALDPTQTEKRTSFTSRFSDYKRDDWLTWSITEDIKLGTEGLGKMREFYRMAPNYEDFETARVILQSHFGGVIDFQDVLNSETG